MKKSLLQNGLRTQTAKGSVSTEGTQTSAPPSHSNVCDRFWGYLNFLSLSKSTLWLNCYFIWIFPILHGRQYLAWHNEPYRTRPVVYLRVRYLRIWLAWKMVQSLCFKGWAEGFQRLGHSFVWRVGDSRISSIHKSHQHGQMWCIGAIICWVTRPTSIVSLSLESCKITMGWRYFGPRLQISNSLAHSEISTSIQAIPYRIHLWNGFRARIAVQSEDLAQRYHVAYGKWTASLIIRIIFIFCCQTINI